ncbi:MAG: DUF4143 domain-containing protein [Promethearchaeota archaeon]
MAIEDFFNKGKVTLQTKKTYLDWIRGDIIKSGKNESLMKEIMAHLLRSRCSPLSWLSIAKNTSINSPHTVQSYVNVFEAIHILRVLNHVSPKGKVNYRKNKKIHFIDPFTYKVLSGFTNVDVLDETIAESVVATHFSRICPTFYQRNSAEIDVVGIINQEPVGFEVK